MIGLDREVVVGAERLERERLPVGAQLIVPVRDVGAAVEGVDEERRKAVMARSLDGDVARQLGLDERRQMS